MKASTQQSSFKWYHYESKEAASKESMGSNAISNAILIAVSNDVQNFMIPVPLIIILKT